MTNSKVQFVGTKPESKDYSDITLEGYNFALSKFFEWLGTKKITPEAVQEFNSLTKKNRRNFRPAIALYCKENNIPYDDSKCFPSPAKGVT